MGVNVKPTFALILALTAPSFGLAQNVKRGEELSMGSAAPKPRVVMEEMFEPAPPDQNPPIVGYSDCRRGP